MHRRAMSRPSPAMIVALLALFVSLGGGAYAALSLPKNSVGTAQLKNGAVTAAKLHANAVISAKVKDHSLRARDLKAGRALGATVPAATVFCDTTDNPCTALVSGDQTAMAFNGTAFDTANLHTSPSLLTAPVDGIYHVEGYVVFPKNSTGVRTVTIGSPEG